MIKFLSALAMLFPALLALAAEAPATFKAGAFTFTRPAKWEWVESKSQMRAAQLKVSSEDGKASAEVVFFHFGAGGGGGTKANIERWLGQFEGPREKLNAKTEETTVRGHKVTYVAAEGTYLSGMPGGTKTPQAGTMLLGGIVESDEGSVFIKFTGPVALAKASQAEFRKLVESGPQGK